jgi:hypothetical protein
MNYASEFFCTDYPPHDPTRAASIDDGPHPDSPSNGDNARSAARACPPPKPDSHDDETWYTDLICNLLHLAHSRELDPTDIITSALNNFHAEAAQG